MVKKNDITKSFYLFKAFLCTLTSYWIKIMARVTVEDCILKVPNRFELVLLAGQRAKDISAGAPLTVEQDRDKNSVIALREIADETIDISALENTLVSGMQRVVKTQETSSEEDLKAADAELAALDAEFENVADAQAFVDAGAFEITEEA